MNNFKKTSLLALLSTICFTIINAFITTNVSAEAIDVSAPDTWKERAAITGLYECYDSVYMRGQIEEIGSFDSFGQAFYDSTSLEPSQSPSILNIGMYNWEGKEAYNCKQFFMGGDAEDGNSDFKGIFNIFSKSGTASTWQEKTNLVKNMGYTEAQASEQSPKECTYYVFAFSNEALGIRRFYLTQNVCLTNDNHITVKPAVSGCTEELSPAPESGCSDDDEDSSGDFIRFLANSDGKTLSVKTKTGVNKDFAYNGNWDEFKGNIDQFFLGDFCTERTPDNRCIVKYDRVPAGGQASPPDINVFVYNRNISNSASVQDTNSYEITDYTRAADKATNFLSNGQYDGKNDKIKITKPEKYAYYLKALKEVLEKGGGQYYSCYTIGSDLATNVGIDNEQDYINKYSSLGIPINVDFSGKTNPKTTAKVDGQQISYCVILKSAVEAHSEDTVPNWVNDDGFFNLTGGPRLDIAALIEEINNLSNEVSESDLMAAINSDPSYTRSTSESTNDEVEPTCQNQGGAGALGWIVCSILDWMEHAAEQLYTDIVVPQLRVEPALFQNGSSSSSSSSTLQPAAEAAWSTFRDIANIIFTIIVLFVIFSQLTGVGIDNYGIKKILPKLIVAAVLINLSYLICLICVDLSNIVGNGLQAFFNSFQILGEDKGGNYGGQGIGNDIGFVAVSIIAVIVTGVAVYKNPALLLVFFISVIGVLISLIFILILLVGRKAVIVLLTVVSPVAFILYMLPNTKKIFDKWFNLWKAMLLVYPICGLLIGGGNFASKLMLVTVGSSGDTASLFAALIVGIIPIFFIPTVIKSAYAAIGHIGGAIAGFGGRFRGGIDRRVRGSQAFQRAQKSSQDRNQRISAMRRAGIKLDKDGNVVESKRPTARLKRSLSGTAAGRRLGLQASMGQSFNEFAAMEATRRGRIAGSGTDAMNAVFAGVADKESAQRVSDHETLMRAGKVQIDGRNLNVNNAGDMQKYHKAMLETAHQKRAAGDTAGYNAAMDKVKAAQNIMAKSDVGRGNIQANYDAAIRSNNTEGLEDAAGHLLGVHGSDIKASNRAMHKLAQDLAKGINASKVKTKIDNNSYNIDSIGGYNAQTLAAADEKALKDLYDNMDAINNATNDRGEHEARDQLARLVNEALDSPNIQPQEKVRKQLEDIRRGLQTDNGGTPTSNPNENRAPGERRTPGGIIY